MHKDFCYGRAGDLITIISVHHNIAVVEGPDKKRFSAPLTEITENEVQIELSPADPTIKKHIRKQSKSIKQTPQNSLF
jgi:hypothetical protein